VFFAYKFLPRSYNITIFKHNPNKLEAKIKGAEYDTPKPEDHGLRPWVNGRSGRRPTGAHRVGTTGFTRGAPVPKKLIWK